MKKLLITTILMSFVFMLAACGGGDSADQTSEDTSSADTEATATADDGVRTIDVVGVDDLRFAVAEGGEGIVTAGSIGQLMELESIEASAGEELRISLTTQSNLPPTAMSHNFVVLTQDADADQFARASLQAADNDYVAPEYEEWVIAATEMLGDGESDTITFTAPSEPGTYQIICTFPGHYSGGMVATLIVS